MLPILAIAMLVVPDEKEPTVAVRLLAHRVGGASATDAPFVERITA
jgi:hypothetical protein